MLEEAGSETVTCLINTLISQDRDCDRAIALNDILMAIGSLLALGWIQVGDMDLGRIRGLDRHVIWNSSRGMYLWKDALRGRPPEIEITKEGMKIFEQP